MTTFDKLFLTVISSVSFATVIVGGVFHPNTVAGAIARLVFCLK